MKTGFVVSLAVAFALFAIGGARAASPGKTCGGIAGLQCGAGQYCRQKPGTCRIVDMSGTCAPIPQFCPKIVLPVCGCNNVTYQNSCEAAAAGVSILHKGPC